MKKASSSTESPPAEASKPLLKRPLQAYGECIPGGKSRQMERLGLHRVEDLLFHFPRRYENRLRFDAFPRQEGGEACCLLGVVAKTTVRRLGGRRMMFEVLLQEPHAHALSTPLSCRWFNAHYVQKMLATGQRVVVYGKPKRSGKQIVMDHPDFEVIEEEEKESPHFNRITPIYPATEGLSQRVLRGWIYRLLSEVEEELDAVESPLPSDLSAMPWGRALRAIHFPESDEALANARREVALAEFFEMQLAIAAQRQENVAKAGTVHYREGGSLVSSFHQQLPFPLTGAQKRAVEEIRLDLARPQPMNRLLHGDVGSGKTVVALSTMLYAIEAGFQAALMAPTQILAEQHYLNFKRWLAPLGVRVALRTGSKREGTALPLFDGQGEAAEQIVVGTHALLYEERLPRLGVAVIDEQHKFGVMQKAALTAGGEVDVLVMSATPIPRALTMTLFGDLDLSTLDELPAGRGEIQTVARDYSKLPDAILFMKKHLAAGRQAYVVYPLIEESEKLEVKAAAAEFEKWVRELAPYRCELLHGRISPDEKEGIMERFRTNQSQVLIATTVIEVGIDVPNANLMLIENAERFGLAQLHQLRGRIGRGKYKSFCILIHDAETEEGREKMAIMEATRNGFEIAEADFRLRGPGNMLGTAQSGKLDLRVGKLPEDAPLMIKARKAAGALFASDPELAKTGNQKFRELLVEHQRKLALSQVS